jgi:hypothetical protein
VAEHAKKKPGRLDLGHDVDLFAFELGLALFAKGADSLAVIFALNKDAL